MKKLICSLAVIGVLMGGSGCYTFHHKVGTGAASGQKTEAAAWFALWGIIPFNTPDTAALAGGATNYTITTQFTPLDVLISFFTGIVTIHKQTVMVEK